MPLLRAASEQRELAAFAGRRRTAHRAAPGRERQRVHDHRRRRKPQAMQADEQPLGLEPGHRGGPRHDDKTRVARIPQQLLQPADRFGKIDKLRGELPGAHDRSIFQQHSQKHLHPFACGIRHLQQSQRVPGRRRIHDDERILFTRFDDRDETKELVDAGWCELHQLGRPTPSSRGGGIGRAQHRANLIQRRFEARAARGQRRRRVELADAQVSGTAANADGLVADPLAEDVAKGMRRIGGEQQHRAARFVACEPQGDSRGDGGLADAALAAKKQQPDVAERRERFGWSRSRIAR